MTAAQIDAIRQAKAAIHEATTFSDREIALRAFTELVIDQTMEVYGRRVRERAAARVVDIVTRPQTAPKRPWWKLW